MGGICGTGSVEGMGVAEGPRQPLSRSLPGGKNPVSVLMEYSQRSGNPIEFIITGQAGPPHDPRCWLFHLPLNLSFSMLFSPTPQVPLLLHISPQGNSWSAISVQSVLSTVVSWQRHNTIFVHSLFTTLSVIIHPFRQPAGRHDTNLCFPPVTFYKRCMHLSWSLVHFVVYVVFCCTLACLELPL